MDIKELREAAKAAGIKYTYVKGAERLEKELAEMADPKPEGGPDPYATLTAEQLNEAKKRLKEQDISESELILKIIISQADVKFLEAIGVKEEWLASLANEYGFTKFQYLTKFKAFRCYRGNNHVDWIDVNDLSLKNGGKQLIQIKQKHQQLPVKKRIIKLDWHDNYIMPINDKTNVEKYNV